MMSSWPKAVAAILLAALAGCMEIAKESQMDPTPYTEKTFYAGSAYRLTFMTPSGTIAPQDPIWRYVFGIVRLDNTSTQPLFVFPVKHQDFLATSYRATIGQGANRAPYAIAYNRAQDANLTGPDSFEPVVVAPGQSIRMASRSLQSVLRLLGAFGYGEEGRPIADLSRICPQFEGLIGVQFADAQGQGSGEAPSDNATNIKVDAPCYAIDMRRDWANDWAMAGDYRNTVDVLPDWKPYATVR